VLSLSAGPSPSPLAAPYVLRYDVSTLTERAVLVALIGLAVAGIALSGVALPPSSWLAPSVLTISVFADFATAIILLGGMRPSEAPRYTRVLCATYLALGFCAIAGTLLWDRMLSEITTPLGQALFLGWPLILGGGGVVYAELRRRAWAQRGRSADEARTSFGNALAWALPCFFGLSVYALAIHASRNPAPVQALPIAESVTTIVCMLAATRCWFTSKRGSLTRAFAISVFGVSCGLVIHADAAAQFSVAWYTEWLLYLASSMVVAFSGLRVLLRTRASLRVAQRTLAIANARFIQRGEALRALRKSAVDDGWGDRNSAHAVLEAGASNIRRDKPICGLLAHIDGDEVVLDARSAYGDDPELLAVVAEMYPGRRFPIAGTLTSLIGNAGHTQWWNQLPDERTAYYTGAAAWKSAIGSSIDVGAQQYFLIFASTREMSDDPFSDDDATFIEALTLHISHRFFEQQQQEQIQFHVEHDTLTGLRNRTEFGHALRAAVRKREPFAVAVVDLDGFRQINETAGHDVGDSVLVSVAAALNAVNTIDVVARLGADDFAVVLFHIDDDEVLARRLGEYRDVFAQPIAELTESTGQPRAVTASFGVAMYPRDGATAEELMQRADVTLDVSKERGRGGTLLYTHDLDVEVRNRRLQRSELLEALDTDAFVVEYQPTVEMNTRRIAGAEALIRWNHPTRGMLAPGEFIPFVARSGLMGFLSQWLFARVLHDLADRPLPPNFRCYINLPAYLLDDVTFLSGISELLDEHRGFADHLGVEITESDAVQNAEGTILAMRRIRQRGIRIAVDDFGTGYSSMAYLKRLPIDIVKIDRSFVNGLPDDGKDAVLCEMFLRLTQQFGLISLAEGIETEAQARWLLEHGCMMGQGYLFAKPLPLEQFVPMLDRSAASLAAVT
jgi:diguanylate cyclase (GGDEF)-like protein